MTSDATARRKVGVDAMVAPHPPPPSWVGDLIVAVLIAAAVFLPFPSEELRPAGWLTAVLVTAPAVFLPLRRRWPVPVLAICLGFYGAAALTGTLSPGATFAVGVAMFGVANRSTRRATIVIGSAAVLVIFLLSMLAALGGFFDPQVLPPGLLVAFAAAAGDGARSGRAYIEAVTERAERAERTREAEARRRVSEERLRIARDLHDAVAHQIAVISLSAGVVSSTLETNPTRAREALGTIRHAARSVLGEIGDLLNMLRADEPHGPGGAPQFGLGHLDRLLDQFATTGLTVRKHIEGDLTRVGGIVDKVAYRVIQESLTNAHKHGSQNRAELLVDVTNGVLRIVVTNPAHETPATGPQEIGGVGVGLVGLRERVTSVRGTVQAGPFPGGWKVAATIPLPKEGTS